MLNHTKWSNITCVVFLTACDDFYVLGGQPHSVTWFMLLSYVDQRIAYVSLLHIPAFDVPLPIPAEPHWNFCDFTIQVVEQWLVSQHTLKAIRLVAE